MSNDLSSDIPKPESTAMHERLQKKGSLIIRPATREEEFAYLTNFLLPNYKNFLSRGYSPLIPNSELFAKAAKDGLETINVEDLRAEFEKIYDPERYQEEKQKFFELSAPILQHCLPQFEKWEKDWGFKLYQLYDLRISLYGPGGHYYPDDVYRGNEWLRTTLDSPVTDTAAIMIRAVPSKTFSRPDPEHSLIHEITHLGVQWLVDKYQLTQREKERLIDNLVKIAFTSEMPNYEMQGIGDNKIDSIFNSGKISSNLENAISEYVQQNPRSHK